MTVNDLLDQGTKLFGDNFNEIACWIGYQLSNEVSNQSELLEIVWDLDELYYQ